MSAESRYGSPLLLLLGTLIPAVLMHSVEARLDLEVNKRKLIISYSHSPCQNLFCREASTELLPCPQNKIPFGGTSFA